MSCLFCDRNGANRKPRYSHRLRPLRPKTSTSHHGSHTLAPPFMPLQILQSVARTGAIDNDDSLDGSAGRVQTTPKLAARARKASTAKRSLELGCQKTQHSAAENPVHPKTKVSINRIQKREHPQPKGSKTLIACANCR